MESPYVQPSHFKTRATGSSPFIVTKELVESASSK